MKAPQNNANKKRELIKSGTHLARCFQVIDLGTQKEVWEGKEKDQRKIWISFELPKLLKVFKEGEPAKPMIISKKFTLSMGDKSKLKPFVESMLGTTLTKEEALGFDTDNLLGMPCALNISTNVEKGYNTILSATPVMEGLEIPEQILPTVKFEVENFNEEVFITLPPFLQEMIKESSEYKNRLTDQDKSDLAAIKAAHRAQNPIEELENEGGPF